MEFQTEGTARAKAQGTNVVLQMYKGKYVSVAGEEGVLGTDDEGGTKDWEET